MQKQGKGRPREVWSLQLQTQEDCPRQAQPLPEERPLPTATHQWLLCWTHQLLLCGAPALLAGPSGSLNVST